MIVIAPLVNNGFELLLGYEVAIGIVVCDPFDAVASVQSVSRPVEVSHDFDYTLDWH